ncbi:MAG: hypothetical protein J1F22_07305 [Lachnospiraceae bacterium]|nr:hypothetical protein [Lachnospiraceae bacterium]
MKSVLGKLIQQEFGRERYVIYTKKLEKKESMDIFCDIYEELKEKSPAHLNQSLKKLLDSVQVSIHISRNFIYITIGYILSLALLLLFGLVWFITYPALALISICYFYKLEEFVKNRYCDRDVRIVLIYKIALFHLLEETCLQKESHEVY